MWFGASPEDPRSSAIGLLLSRRTRLLPPLPFRGEGWGEGRGRTPPPLPFRGEGWGEGRGRTPPPLPFRGEGWGEGQGRTPLRHQRVHLLRRQVVVIAMVKPHHRRVLAGAEALNFFVAEQPVRRNLVG